MSDKITFRFMSGEHIGSTLKLGEGRYTLGGSEECDICLNDSDLKDAAVAIEIDASLKVFVEVLNGSAMIDGQDVTVRTALGAGSLLAMGLVSLMYVGSGDDFVPVSLEKIIGHTQNDSSHSDENESPVGDRAREDAKESLNTRTDAIADDDAKPGSGRSFLVFNIAGVILLSLILIVLIAGSSIFADKSAFDSDLKTVSAYIKNQGFSDLKAYCDDSSIIVSGTLKDESVFRAFLEGLPETSCSARLDITLEDRDIKSIEKAFLLHGFYVKARKLGTNEYKISGYARDPYVVFNAMSQTQKEFSALTLKNDFTYEKELKTIIKEKDAKLYIALKIKPDDSYVLYDNRLSQSEEQDLNALKSVLEKKVGAPVHFVSYVEVNKSPIEVFDRVEDVRVTARTGGKAPGVKNLKDGSLGAGSDMYDEYEDVPVRENDVVGVTLKPMKFIALKNGIRYFEGALMPSGFTLKRIELNRLVFEKEGVVVDYALK